MNELQLAEYDLLRCFIEACEKLDLPYFLVCGSALGASKYGGFIPWDDDLDVALLRPDYEIFVANAQRYLPQNVFLQNRDTDKEFPQIFSKLRNTDTTFIEKASAEIDMVHGVYIDIFPLDGYPRSPVAAKRFECRKRRDLWLRACLFQMPNARKVTRIFLAIIRVLLGKKGAYRFVDDLSQICAGQPVENSALLCNHGNWQGKLEYAPREQYGEGTWATFESLKVRIPERYDEYLTQKYGNWRADIPHEQQVGHHYAEVIDLSRPYTDYIEKRPNGKIRIRKIEELK